MRNKIIFGTAFLLWLAGGFAQRKENVFAVMEDSIVNLHRSMTSERESAIRYQQNEKLLYILEKTLGLNNSISYPFDSLKTIAVVTSPDKKIRIFTWYLVGDKGVHEHYGFVQAYNENQKRYMVYPLIDKWQKVDRPTGKVLACDNWFGAVYTKLIMVKGSSGTYYTLLGWNGGNIFSQYKLIEVLTLNDRSRPVFGSPVFRGYGKNSRPVRIVFEYSKKGYMYLNYEKQTYTQRSAAKNKKTKQYTIEKITANMIVFSRLIPMREGLQNLPQMMVGEISINDAFVEQDGKWVFKQDIIAGNPSKPMPQRERKREKYYTPEN
ncbi:MAG: hypothetical protein FWH36_08095 [Lentimicrobiaceae bacterium]|nr:hypothetical protein [Lentimicrobiaceae bacterium]